MLILPTFRYLTSPATDLVTKMVVAASATTSKRSSFIITFLSRLRRRNSKDIPKQEAQNSIHRDPELRLIPSPLPLVLPEHQQSLSNLGWTTITFPLLTPISGLAYDLSTLGPHPLQSAYEDLLQASQNFFNLLPEDKGRWKHKLGSEEGWSSIPGEKEFITLRTLEYCPEILRGPAKRYWDLIGAHLENTLGRIATSLDLKDPDDPAKGLKKFVGPCGIMQNNDQQKTATMLRLFRYERWEAKVVAEPHADLGLLSVVVGNVPGLEVWDGVNWFQVEQEVKKIGMEGATLLAGRQLERLSNGWYPAGGHRVVSYGGSGKRNEEEEQYRFSIVFVLRAHESVVINSKELETPVTGRWPSPVQGLTAGEMYAEIRSRHFNINISMEEREIQRYAVRKINEKTTTE